MLCCASFSIFQFFRSLTNAVFLFGARYIGTRFIGDRKPIYRVPIYHKIEAPRDLPKNEKQKTKPQQNA